MTGLPGLNFDAFNEVQRQLEEAGYEVLNPVRQEHGLTQEKYRELGIIDVLNADGVAVLEGYKDSRGALLETFVAYETGREVKPWKEWL